MPSREQVIQTHQQFAKAGYQTFDVEHEGQFYTCFLLPAKLCPELPNFAFQCVADDRQDPDLDAVFGVSDAIPEDFRAFVVRHEINEYWGEMTCQKAAEAEAIMLFAAGWTDEQTQDYLRMRRTFFKLLIPFATAAGTYPAEKLREFSSSRDYLLSIQ